MPSLIQKAIARHPVAVMAASVILFMGVQAVFSFCGKKTCFAFNNVLYDSWFPYKAEQSIIFTSGGKSDTLHITHTERSKQEERSVGYGNNKCYPSAESSGNFGKTDSTRLNYFRSACYLEENATNPTGNLNIKGLSLAWENISDTGVTISGYSGGEAHSLFQPSITIGNNFYYNVQVITPNETGKTSSGIANLYIALYQGIIGFEEYPSGQLWIKQ